MILRKIGTSVFIGFFILVAGFVWLFVGSDEAYAAIGFLPFGGRVLATIPCTCSPGSALVTVGPPRGGLFMKVPVTRTYQYYKVLPPSWVLGLASGYAACMQINPTGAGCIPAGGGPIMLKVGTSLY
jgi:hypothetical protein